MFFAYSLPELAVSKSRLSVRKRKTWECSTVFAYPKSLALALPIPQG